MRPYGTDEVMRTYVAFISQHAPLLVTSARANLAPWRHIFIERGAPNLQRRTDLVDGGGFSLHHRSGHLQLLAG